MERPSEILINRVLEGTAQPEEATLVAKWFETAEGQEELSARMDRDFAHIKSDLEELYVDHAIPSDRMWAVIRKSMRRKRLRRRLLRVAAVLVPILLIAGLYFQLNTRVDLFGKGEFEEVYVAKGERIQLMFQDGTKVYLNSDTRIKYPKTFGLSERKVFLEGSAYFIVTPNKKRPFILDLEKSSIQVLGTSFCVNAYPSDKTIKVLLDEGKVNFVSWRKTDNPLDSGQELIYDKMSGLCTIIRKEDSKSDSLWKDDIISFKDQPLAEVIEVLNRWYNVEFIVEDSRAYAYSFTMVSENTLLEKVLADLEKVAPVKFIYEDKKVRVRVE